MKEGDKAYNEMLLGVQQQFLSHREKTSMKLQKIEEVLDLVVQQFQLFSKKKVQGQEEDFVNPFG